MTCEVLLRRFLLFFVMYTYIVVYSVLKRGSKHVRHMYYVISLTRHLTMVLLFPTFWMLWKIGKKNREKGKYEVNKRNCIYRYYFAKVAV